MGKRLIIPGITSFTGPKIYADPIMSKGSLLLWDPTHSDGGDARGVVAGAALSNIAADISGGILGVSPSVARPTIFNTNPANSVPALKQRTSKGGIYGLWSHTSGLTTPSGLGIEAAFLKNYLFDNSDHAFFASIWMRSLRRGVQGSQNAPMPLGIYSRVSSPSGSTLFDLSGSGSAYTLGQRFPGQGTFNALWDTDAPRIRNIGRQGWNGNGLEKPANVGLTNSPYFSVGTVPGYGAFNLPGVSGIIERVYIEDMTVSGRTYAELDAIDFAMFTAAHAPGGEWFGDTYPDPATFP
ncbi:hypothetical protein [Gemmobacter sp. 24YEA27]|uniref:hypothetical protein n=1 Tax=Gemmobacter sp. 24YEA27 TaxID=3040672 RepID=UPI0024B33C4F|nr:hypothetical protein [Gemmobacter sp. 24YEA27]